MGQLSQLLVRLNRQAVGICMGVQGLSHSLHPHHCHIHSQQHLHQGTVICSTSDHLSMNPRTSLFAGTWRLHWLAGHIISKHLVLSLGSLNVSTGCNDILIPNRYRGVLLLVKRDSAAYRCLAPILSTAVQNSIPSIPRLEDL